MNDIAPSAAVTTSTLPVLSAPAMYSVKRHQITLWVLCFGTPASLRG